MEITQTDIDKLKNLKCDIFIFLYFLQGHIPLYDKDFHNSVVQYIESKKLTKLKVENCDTRRGRELEAEEALTLLKKNKVSKIIFNPEDRENYRQGFLDTLLGQNIEKLEGFFSNYYFHEIPKYFKNKDLLIMDSITRIFYLWVRGEIKKPKIFSGLEDIDINVLYHQHDKLFKNLNKAELYRKYEAFNRKVLQEGQKYEVQARQNYSFAVFISQVRGIIVFKRPTEELEKICSANYESLRSPEMKAFIKKINVHIMPEIVAILSKGVEEAKKYYDSENIKLEEEKNYKVMKINVADTAIKYQKKFDDCRFSFCEKNNIVAEMTKINMEYIEKDEKEEFIAFLLKGEDKSLQLYSRLLEDIINNKDLLFSKKAQCMEYCRAFIEKKLIGESLTLMSRGVQFKI